VRHLTAFLLISLGSAALAAASAPSLVADLNPGFTPFDPLQGGRFFYDYTSVNGRVVFLARTQDDSQCGLWVTDAAVGVERLADFCDVTPSRSGSPRILAAGSSVAFLADPFGRLWRTDGTAAGTFSLGDVKLKTIGPEDLRLGPDRRTLFFRGCTPSQGCEPWRSDGTLAGTRLLRELRPGPASSSQPLYFTLRGDRLLFADNKDLWSTNGTLAGTVRLAHLPGNIWQILPYGGAVYLVAGVDLWVLDPKAVKPRRLQSFSSDSYLMLQEAGGRLLFVESSEDDYTLSLWTSDGTRGGTRPLGPPFDFGAGLSPGQIANVGARAVFAASPNEPELDLWFIDPAMKAPRRFRDCPGGCPRLASYAPLAPFKSRLFFAGQDAAHGRELWETDGTPQGTRLVKDLCPGTCDGTPAAFRPALGRLLFEDTKNDLWATDGTAAGTVRIGPLPYPAGYQGDLIDVAEEGTGQIFYSGIDPVNGPQPWVSDLTPEGTEPILGIGGSLAASSQILNTAPFGGRVLFMACDGASRQLWVSDGTAAGTVPLPGPAGPCSSAFYVKIEMVNGFAFFIWDNQLWRTDGTPAGTVLLEDTSPRILRSTTPSGDKILFVVDPESDPDASGWFWEFWTTDGSPQGTREAFRVDLGGTPDMLTSAGGYALFVAQTAVFPFPYTLWRTDGTEAGTQPILDVNYDGSRLYLGPEVARIGGRTFFLAEGLERQLGIELWVTDGTAAGTAPVLPGPTRPDPNAPRPRQLHSLKVFKDALYFAANTGDPAQPRGIWRSDGTAAGTRLLMAFGSQPQDVNGNTLLPTFTPAGDRLFFRMDDGVHGTELWRTDGTPEGTALVRDIAPGPKDASITSLAAAGGKVYFSATDGEHGLELWESDGTASGTRLVQDIAPGTASSNPEQIVATGDKLFFAADDGAHGRELWELPLP